MTTIRFGWANNADEANDECMLVGLSDEMGRRSGIQLLDSRDMSASRASLSILDDDSSSVCSQQQFSHQNQQHDDDDVADTDAQFKYNHRSSSNVSEHTSHNYDKTCNLQLATRTGVARILCVEGAWEPRRRVRDGVERGGEWEGVSPPQPTRGSGGAS